MKEKKKDLTLGILSISFAAFIFANSITMRSTGYEGDPGPKLMPLIGSVVMAIFGIILILHPEKDGEVFLTRRQWKDVAVLGSTYILMAVCLWLFGFTVTVPIIMFLVTLLLSRISPGEFTLKQRLLKSVIYAAITSAAIYVVYIVLLGAQLPRGILWD